MKIAYIYDAIYPCIKGGAEKRIYELSRRLASRGHEVHCYGMKWWKGERTVERDGVHLHGICPPINLYSGDHRSMAEAIYFASKVLSSREKDWEVVDCQNFPYFPCISAKLLCQLRKSNLFITWHEVWGDYWYEYLGRKGFFGVLVEKAVSRLTDNNIAVSEMTKKRLESLGVKKTQVVPNGIDCKEIDCIEPSTMKSDVVYIGRLVRHKNVDQLIKATGVIARSTPDIRVIIIGDGPENYKLKALARELDLEKNILFTGFLSNYNEALSLMKASKVFVSPSSREGFGMAALEANACGLPVVTVNHEMNAVCDLVTKESGLICEPSGENLAAAIVEEMDLAKSMRRGCVDLARKYGWESICDRIELVYRT
jgi:glycosyltransferase involved in cell wall biosynthesis